jgi:putative transcriptional regulator
MSIENNIRVERAKKRITQQELAEAVGTSRQTINAVENKKFVPSLELGLKIKKYFGVKDIDDIFKLED